MRILLVTALVTLGSVALGQNLRSGGRLTPEQAMMDIRHYTVALRVDPVREYIEGYCEIRLNLTTRAPELVFDLWHNLRVTQVWVDGRKESFQQTANDLLKIRGTLPFEKGKVHVKVSYGGKPGVAERAPWIGGFQWSKDSAGNPWVAITCQSEGAKIYFPCKDHPSDEPNEGADIIITVPAGLTVAGPGLLKKVARSKETDTFYWSTAYTINNYSIVFNIGKYKKVSRTFTSESGKKVPMEFYVLEEHADKGPFLLEMMERSAHFNEKYFGEYPWVNEKIGMAETPHLGMEHQTMIAYGNQFSYTKLGDADFDWLMHHEFGHEWWGNKITNRDWAHMWIQEGICSFGDALMTRELGGEEAYQKRMQQTALHIANNKPLVQGEEIDTDETYQGDLYGKGAFFMHTLRYVMGDDIFFPALRKFATAPGNTYDSLVTSDDVERFFTREARKPLKPLFDLYLKTVQKVEVSVKQISDTTFLVKFNNLDGSWPLDVITSTGSKRETVDKKGITVTSHSWPLIDPKVFWMKRVILE